MSEAIDEGAPAAAISAQSVNRLRTCAQPGKKRPRGSRAAGANIPWHGDNKTKVTRFGK
jgi:hypothetical protein